MHGRNRGMLVTGIFAIVLTLSFGAASLRGEEPVENNLLAQVAPAAAQENVMVAPEPVAMVDEVEERPFSVFFRYAMTTDYVSRGINYSEYPNEKRDRPNHEISAGFEVDCFERRLGQVGVEVFAQFFSGMKAADPSRADHLGEIDYTVYWTNDFPEAATRVKLGWTYRSWPRVSGDADDTNEFFAKLTFNDGPLFGEATGVFNPYIFYAVDVDTADNGGWLELGVEHDFAMEEYTDVVGLRYMTITPSISLGIDNRYLHAFSASGAIPSAREREAGREADRLANIVYGLAMEYNLSDALQVSPEFGNLSVGLFVKFSDALREDILNDELWGGMQFTYKW